MAHPKEPFLFEGDYLCMGCGRKLRWILTHESGGRWCHARGDPFPVTYTGC